MAQPRSAMIIMPDDGPAAAGGPRPGLDVPEMLFPEMLFRSRVVPFLPDAALAAARATCTSNSLRWHQLSSSLVHQHR